MKTINFTITLMLLTFCLFSQKIDYNLDEGYIAKGYDVVEYFNNNSKEGSNVYTYTFGDVKYKFINQNNLEKFKSNPEKYKPQYGGWCAYAMGAKNGDKIDIDPETFEIRNGKLYLFYNKFFINTYDSWVEEGADKLKNKGDENWEKVKFKN